MPLQDIISLHYLLLSQQLFEQIISLHGSFLLHILKDQLCRIERKTSIFILNYVFFLPNLPRITHFI